MKFRDYDLVTCQALFHFFSDLCGLSASSQTAPRELHVPGGPYSRRKDAVFSF